MSVLSDSFFKFPVLICYSNRLLNAHPEYHPLFPAIANVPAADLANSPALKTLSFNVLSKFTTVIESAGNLGALSQQLTALGADHKKLGVKRADFDVSLMAILNNYLTDVNF